MSAALNNVTAPDNYNDDATLRTPSAVRLRIQVNNQPIYWERGSGPPGGSLSWDEPEEFLLPGLYVFEERCDAVRVRAATPAAALAEGSLQAQVTIASRTHAELPAGGPGHGARHG